MKACYMKYNIYMNIKALFRFSVSITYNSVSITHNSKLVGPMAE